MSKSIRSQRGDIRDKSVVIIPDNSYNRWKSSHWKLHCPHGCVTEKTHFRHWRDTYYRVLDIFYRELVNVAGPIQFEDFVFFAYCSSSKFISKYL